MVEGRVAWWVQIYLVPEGIGVRRHGHIPRWRCQDSSGSNCDTAFQSLRPHFHTWIRHHRVQIWTRLESLESAAGALRSVPTLPSSIQDIGEKWMLDCQHWMEINLLAFQANISVHYQVVPLNNLITCDWSCDLSPVSRMRRPAPALVFAPNLCLVWKKREDDSFTVC